MRQFKNYLLPFAGLAGLAVIGTLMNRPNPGG
jgi:hypothetical protein